MGCLACVSVPELPLQLLLRQHPLWALHPAAVVAEDKPHALLLWVNERGRQHGVMPGQRYSAALAVCRELRAAPVTPELIQAGVDQIVQVLRDFTPHIEPANNEPGVFWVDASGLLSLYGSLASWAERVERALVDANFTAAVVAGHSRFFTYALARARWRGALSFVDAESERVAAEAVPMARLRFDPAARDTLHKLGVTTVGAFLKLPPSALLERFGPELLALHRLATGDTFAPLQPVAETEPLLRTLLFDEGEQDSTRLLFCVKRELDPLLLVLRLRHQALLSLHLVCDLERTRNVYDQTIKPAEPTLDARQLLDLVRLRLEAMPLPAPASSLTVEVTGLLVTAEQLRLMTSPPRRDLAAADRALSRIIAELGPDAVTRVVLQDAHLPEASFRFERLEHVCFPDPAVVKQVQDRSEPPAIRRLWSKPVELTSREHMTPIAGPYVISGGWWARQVTRHYYYVETESGDLLYCFYDAERDRFMVHGAL